MDRQSIVWSTVSGKLRFSKPFLKAQYVISAAIGALFKEKSVNQMWGGEGWAEQLFNCSESASSGGESWMQSQTFWRNKQSCSLLHEYNIIERIESTRTKVSAEC